jgi:tripartite-type tricarboxylate transporter receptor subunit TctC
MNRSAYYLGFAAMALFGATEISRAQTTSFAGRPISLVVGYGPGGGYDQYSRTLSRYFGTHLPGNPNVIVQYMPGASTLVAVRHLDTNAPTDGTVVVMFDPGLITSSIVTPETTKIKLTDYHWIGTLARDQRVCYASVASGVKTLADLQARNSFNMGATSKGADAYVNGAILRKVFNAHIQQIEGYPTSNDERMAVDRGELDGNCAAWASIPQDWLVDHKVNILVRFSRSRPSDMPADVPFVTDLATSPEQKQLLDILNAPGELARPFIVSKKVPDETVATLRTAFQATLTDPGFIADMKKQSLPIDPVSGEDAEKMLTQFDDVPRALVEKMKDVLE